MSRYRLLTLFMAAALAGACDDAPDPGGPGDGNDDPTVAVLFERYVALGNSITAGVQSAGIHRGTQNQAYPVLLAQLAGVDFVIREVELPGCPPPIVLEDVLEGQEPASTCAGLVDPDAGPVQNVAIPGAKLGDALRDRGSQGAVLLLDGRTQVEAMRAADPTVVSVFLGGNDALGGLDGEAAFMTSLASFEADLDGLAAEIAAADPIDAILLAPADPLLSPAVQPGLFFWIARDLLPVAVDPGCASGEGASNLVSVAVLLEEIPISCGGGDPFVLDAADQAEVSARVAAYGDLVRGVAEANGWLFVDPNDALRRNLDEPTQLRRCQGLLEAPENQRPFVALLSCPSPLASHVFGRLLSLDPIHPSGAGQRLIANEIIAALNARYDFGLQDL